MTFLGHELTSFFTHHIFILLFAAAVVEHAKDCKETTANSKSDIKAIFTLKGSLGLFG